MDIVTSPLRTFTARSRILGQNRSRPALDVMRERMYGCIVHIDRFDEDEGRVAVVVPEVEGTPDIARVVAALAALASVSPSRLLFCDGDVVLVAS